VDTELITRDPNRVFTPGFRVNAVVHVPWGGHPSPVPGFYNRDHQAFLDYRDDSKTSELFSQWCINWVDDLAGHQAYLERLGEHRLTQLQLKHHILSEPVDYGY